MEVSVVIPCHNAERYLAQTIGSVLEQSRPPKEIIVVDDGSTDRSAQIARSFGDPVTVASKQCGGASQARNYGYRFATGDALMFLDADDVLGPKALESLVEALSTNPQGVALCLWYRLEEVDGKWVRQPASCRSRRKDRDYLGNWLTGWWHPPCSVLWSRSAYKRTGGWDERALVNNDGDIMMRALVEGVPFISTPNGAAYYRRLPEEQTSVSDTRFTEAGIKARIYVAQKIAAWLEERNLIDRYREPLREKFEEIGQDCEQSYPGLHKQCKSLAQRYGDPLQLRTTWQEIESLFERVATISSPLRKKLGRIKRSLIGTSEPVSSRQNHEPPEEIRFGLDAASKAKGSIAAKETSGKAADVDPPEVSVVIPTYNRAHLVGRAIESVLAQTFEDFEILVIDDASTDNTASVVEGYQDSRIRYLVQSENRGVSAARNRGLREARGQFIAFLDSDDEWFPDKLEKQAAHFRQLSEDVGLIYCGVETIDDKGETWIFHPEHRGDVYRHMLFENAVHTGSGVMVRREVICSAGFFDEKIPAIEDWDYWVRIARFYKFDFVEEPLFRYHDVEDIKRKSLNTWENLEARAWFFRKHSAEMRRAEVDHLFLIESARRHLRHAGDPRGTQKLMLKALLKQPLKPEVYNPPFSRLDLLAPEALAPRTHRAIKRGRDMTLQLLDRRA